MPETKVERIDELERRIEDLEDRMLRLTDDPPDTTTHDFIEGAHWRIFTLALMELEASSPGFSIRTLRKKVEDAEAKYAASAAGMENMKPSHRRVLQDAWVARTKAIIADILPHSVDDPDPTES